MQSIWILGFHILIFHHKYVTAGTLSNQSGEGCKSVCSTPTCSEQAQLFTRSMDATVDPCNDFYQFTCGNYIKNSIIPDDKSALNHFLTIQDKIRDQVVAELDTPIQSSDLKTIRNAKVHYQNCLNESAIEEIGTEALLQLLEQLGGWPILLGDKWNEDNYNWQDTASAISKQGINPSFPFQLSVQYDPTNTSNYIFGVYSAGTSVDDSYFVTGSESLQTYETLLVEIAVLLGAKREKATSELKKCADFEVELHKAKIPIPSLRLLSAIENRKSVKELTDKYPKMPWLEVINSILQPNNVTITANDMVIVSDPQYFSKIAELIGKTPKAVLANYQIWRVIFELIDYLPKSFRDQKFNLKRATTGVKEEVKRNETCLELTRDNLPTAIGSMYIKHHFNKESKDILNEMFLNMKEALEAILNTTTWMDEDTRKNALEKLQYMKALMGYPDELSDDQKIEEYYDNLGINIGSFFDGYRKISSHQKNLTFNLIKTSVAETGWTLETNVAIVNAYYYPYLNKILSIAGILQEPFFKFDRPDYLNYGGIGFVIGHEMTHGFDTSGRKYDKNGNYNNWWKNETSQEFEKRVECLVEQYNQYVVKQINETVNGTRTKGENIADGGGVKVSYHAYLKSIENRETAEECLPYLNYTPKQMFWINAGTIWCSKTTDSIMRSLIADEHSPPEARVNVVLSNIKEFSDAFNCPVGSKMNPENKCVVW